MSFVSFLNSIIFLGSLQGFIIGILLYRSSKERASGKLLAWLLLIMALACLKIYLNSTDLLSNQIGMLIDALVPFVIAMPIGPLIYLYCKYELRAGVEIHPGDRKHFYSIIIDLFHHVGALVFLFMLLLGWANPTKNNFGAWFDAYNVYSDIPRWISLTVYLILSFRLLKSGETQEEPGYAKPSSSRWLKEFLWVFLAFDFLWLLYLVPYVIPTYTDLILKTFDWYPIYVPLVVIIYWLGIRGFLIGRREMNLSRKPVMLQLSEEVIDRTSAALLKSMNDKLYRDAELNLTRFAHHLNISPKIISTVLNQKFGKSFNEYINEYRVEEVKGRLVKGESKNYTIVSLAYECGFNSQPTFQRAFKSIVGLTPKEFIKQNDDVVTES
jgi:AraC-like DNA-binding protein